jgi:tripartite-type tricarboxylate transporter receptor subunit TctC
MDHTYLMRALFLASTVAQSLIFISNALAQSYPARSIAIVVPYAPGGPTDTFARIFAEHTSLASFLRRLR